jgi:hypothetical protein
MEEIHEGVMFICPSVKPNAAKWADTEASG